MQNCLNNYKKKVHNIFKFVQKAADDLNLNLWNWRNQNESLPLNLSRHRLGLAISPCIPGQYRFVFGCLWCCATWAAAAAAWCKSSNLKYGFTALFTPPPPLEGGEAEVEWFVVEAILFVFVEAVAVSEVKARAAAADRRFRIVSMPCGLQCP